MNQLAIRIPELFSGVITATDFGIGSGGVSGSLNSTFTLSFDNGNFSGDLAGRLFGLSGGLQEISLSLQQNIPTESSLTGQVLLPFFEEPVEVEIGIDLDGGFTVGLTSTGQNGLFELEKEDLFKIQLDSLEFEVEDGVFTTKLSGQLTPLFAGLNWPAFDVRELAIDSDGNVHLDGGWLDLPKQYSLDFNGFIIEITQLGFGKTEDDSGKWIGFSGALNLVEGIQAGASVEGLRITWYNDGRDPSITLEGVGVELEIPDVLYLKGKVAFREFEQAGNTIRRFEGDIELDLVALDIQMDAKLVIGTAKNTEGERYRFFAIHLGVEINSGIPLGPLPVSIYGIAGLFALNMEPNRLPEEAWYGIGEGEGWYKRDQVGVTDIQNKWENKKDSMALGAGVTLGTTSDAGFTLNGRLLLVIVFPGPIVMLEGMSNVLKKRADLSEEAAFRSIAIFDKRAREFLIGLDAQYKYSDKGELIDIRGGAEAFFPFNDPLGWHLYLGQNEPRSLRIRAEVFEFLQANSYFMLDAHRLAMGIWVGYDYNKKIGPAHISLEAWLESNVIVGWMPAHFYGNVWLHGNVGLKVYGVGFGLTVDALMEADVFDPFHVLAEIAVKVRLPWPLKKFKAKVRLEWGPKQIAPPLPLPLQEVAIQHAKVTTTWNLPRGDLLLPNYDSGDGFYTGASGGDLAPSSIPNIPVVAMDSRPVLTFRRPVHDDALAGINPQPPNPAWEWIGDPARNQGPARVRYGLEEISLARWDPSSQIWALVASTSSLDPVTTLFGSWSALPGSDGSGNAGLNQTQLWLWTKTPFETTSHSGSAWAEWITDTFPNYPCLPAPVIEEVCCDFERFAPGESVQSPYTCPNVPAITITDNPIRIPSSFGVDFLSPPIEGKTSTLCAFNSPVTIELEGTSPSIRIVAVDRYQRRCIKFLNCPSRNGPNPLLEQEVEFTLRPQSKFPQSEILKAPNGECGLYIRDSIRIKFPSSCKVHNISIKVSYKQELNIIVNMSGGLNQTTKHVSSSQPDTINLKEDINSIRTIYISGPDLKQPDAFYLHEICYDCLDQKANLNDNGQENLYAVGY